MYHKIYFILSPLIHNLICLGSNLLTKVALVVNASFEISKEVGRWTLNPASVVYRHILVCLCVWVLRRFETSEVISRRCLLVSVVF